MAIDELAEEHLDVINLARTKIDHHEELFLVPADVMDDVNTTVMMDANPKQLNNIIDRKDSSWDSFEAYNSRKE